MYFPHCVCLQLRSPAPGYKPTCDFFRPDPQARLFLAATQESCVPDTSFCAQLGHPSLCRESQPSLRSVGQSNPSYIYIPNPGVFMPRSPYLTSWAKVFKAPLLRPLCGGRTLPLLLTGDSGPSTCPLSVLLSPTLGSVKLPEPLIQDPFNTEISPHQR